MLPNNYGVNGSLTDKQLTLERSSLVDEACLLEALGIVVYVVHIALAIHHLVPLPVDYRATCNTHLEYVRVVCDERDSHKSTIAPAVYADAILVNPLVRHQPLHTSHLVSHLGLTALAVDSLLELCTTIRCASVVHYEYHVATLCHIHLPATQRCEVCVLHKL